MDQNYINHIALVLDCSLSMTHLKDQVVKVADNQIAHLAQRSKELDQETRVSVYTFSDDVECVIFDKDVLRLPSLKGQYKIKRNTALIDATIKSQEDLADTSELYGDHAFLTYVLTDGEENVSKRKAKDLQAKIAGLPDHWTVACLVPNQNGVFEAKRFGFPANNIAVWDTTTVKGLEGGFDTIKRATDNFMTGRSKGIRGTTGLFDMSAANLNKTSVKKLKELPKTKYYIFDVHNGDSTVIADFVYSRGVAYQPGIAYYQLSKRESIQPYKKIAVREKRTGKVYSGDQAREIIGLPGNEVRVSPQDNPEYEVYVQSTSVNRKLVPDTNLLVMK